MKDLDITPVQYGVLGYLTQADGATAKELGDQFGLEASTVTGILDRLEKKSLVERRQDEQDRRAHKIVVTEEGWTLSEEMFKSAVRANNRVKEIVGKENVKYLIELLTKIVDSTDEQANS
ncbi:MAG: MarR family transcriptional regulator [Clostridioides sp.]|nr:MarR family transcriptional regulator [Clostridioides sp.]